MSELGHKYKLCYCGAVNNLEDQTCSQCHASLQNAAIIDIFPAWLREQEKEEA